MKLLVEVDMELLLFIAGAYLAGQLIALALAWALVCVLKWWHQR